MKSLVIRNLHVSVEGKEILKGVNLTVNENEVHALMGPNGNGKSTLLAAVMGNPKYTVTEGTIEYDGKDLLAMPVNERSIAGIFLAMQYPQEIPGVTNSDFLRAAMNARSEKPVPLFRFIKAMEKTIKDLQMKEDLAHRFLITPNTMTDDEAIVQMEMLKPSLSMLDEIDSGLDVDALHIVADALNRMREENGMSMIVVSHYERFYQLIKPTYTHVLVDGRIVLEGDASVADRIDAEGYDWIYREYNVQPAAEATQVKTNNGGVLGTCAVRTAAESAGRE